MLEIIFQGFLEWAFTLIMACWEYFSTSLLNIMSMDFAYLESHIPILPVIQTGMLAVGWALLIGNLVFQAARSMLTGLGFEAEDPKLLFTRTFVFSFLLLASSQICQIALNFTSKVIQLLQLPSAVYITTLNEGVFNGFATAWLLVIVCSLVVMYQSIKLFVEMAERYFILAMLTITAPLAFGMGGSKSTSGIFSGWCKMYGSMCLLMALNVVFVKILMSVLAYSPVGVDVLPWMVLIMAVVRTAKKSDSIVTRIGLNPAITNEPRFPGVLSMIVARTMISGAAKVISQNGANGGRRSGGTRQGGPVPGGAGGNRGGSGTGGGQNGNAGRNGNSGQNGNAGRNGGAGNSGTHTNPASSGTSNPSGASTSGNNGTNNTAGTGGHPPNNNTPPNASGNNPHSQNNGGRGRQRGGHSGAQNGVQGGNRQPNGSQNSGQRQNRSTDGSSHSDTMRRDSVHSSQSSSSSANHVNSVNSANSASNFTSGSSASSQNNAVRHDTSSTHTHSAGQTDSRQSGGSAQAAQGQNPDGQKTRKTSVPPGAQRSPAYVQPNSRPGYGASPGDSSREAQSSPAGAAPPETMSAAVDGTNQQATRYSNRPRDEEARNRRDEAPTTLSVERDEKQAKSGISSSRFTNRTGTEQSNHVQASLTQDSHTQDGHAQDGRAQDGRAQADQKQPNTSKMPADVPAASVSGETDAAPKPTRYTHREETASAAGTIPGGNRPTVHDGAMPGKGIPTVPEAVRHNQKDAPVSAGTSGQDTAAEPKETRYTTRPNTPMDTIPAGTAKPATNGQTVTSGRNPVSKNASAETRVPSQSTTNPQTGGATLKPAIPAQGMDTRQGVPSMANNVTRTVGKGTLNPAGAAVTGNTSPAGQTTAGTTLKGTTAAATALAGTPTAGAAKEGAVSKTDTRFTSVPGSRTPGTGSIQKETGQLNAKPGATIPGTAIPSVSASGVHVDHGKAEHGKAGQDRAVTESRPARPSVNPNGISVGPAVISPAAPSEKSAETGTKETRFTQRDTKAARQETQTVRQEPGKTQPDAGQTMDRPSAPGPGLPAGSPVVTSTKNPVIPTSNPVETAAKETRFTNRELHAAGQDNRTAEETAQTERNATRTTQMGRNTAPANPAIHADRNIHADQHGSVGRESRAARPPIVPPGLGPAAAQAVPTAKSSEMAARESRFTQREVHSAGQETHTAQNAHTERQQSEDISPMFGGSPAQNAAAVPGTVPGAVPMRSGVPGGKLPGNPSTSGVSNGPSSGTAGTRSISDTRQTTREIRQGKDTERAIGGSNTASSTITSSAQSAASAAYRTNSSTLSPIGAGSAGHSAVPPSNLAGTTARPASPARPEHGSVNREETAMKPTAAPGQIVTPRPGMSERTFADSRQTARETVRTNIPGIGNRIESHGIGTVRPEAGRAESIRPESSVMHTVGASGAMGAAGAAGFPRTDIATQSAASPQTAKQNSVIMSRTAPPSPPAMGGVSAAPTRPGRGEHPVQPGMTGNSAQSINTTQRQDSPQNHQAGPPPQPVIQGNSVSSSPGMAGNQRLDTRQTRRERGGGPTTLPTSENSAAQGVVNQRPVTARQEQGTPKGTAGPVRGSAPGPGTAGNPPANTRQSVKGHSGTTPSATSYHAGTDSYDAAWRPASGGSAPVSGQPVSGRPIPAQRGHGCGDFRQPRDGGRSPSGGPSLNYRQPQQYGEARPRPGAGGTAGTIPLPRQGYQNVAAQNPQRNNRSAVPGRERNQTTARPQKGPNRQNSQGQRRNPGAESGNQKKPLLGLFGFGKTRSTRQSGRPSMPPKGR